MWTQIFFAKIHYGYQKPQNLMLISNLLKKLQKIHAKKLSTKRNVKMVDFYYCVQKFSAYNFLWCNCFAFFATDSKISITLYICRKIWFWKNLKVIKLKAVFGENFVGHFTTHELCTFLKEVTKFFPYSLCKYFLKEKVQIW